MNIVFATGNEHKMQEIRSIMGEFSCPVISMKEAGIDVEIEENGTSFEENALIKARTVAAETDDLVLADDRDYRFHIYSSRFRPRQPMPRIFF